MKAVIYGPSETLQIADVDMPVPLDDEVLIKVRAASVNPFDCSLLRNGAFVRGLMSTLLGMRVKRPGVDLAGEVGAVGRDVTRFQIGDAVFGGARGGAFAEYARAPESGLTKKPSGVSFEAAAGANIAARTALQGIRDHVAIRPGQTVLINGASGGIGTFAIQIAKWLGADVTAVCSTGNMGLVRSLGADHVIDYTKEDFSHKGERFDAIFDLVGDKSLRDCSRVLKPEGKWIGGGILGKGDSMIRLLPGLLSPALMSIFGKQKFSSFMTKRNEEDLPAIAELMDAGTVRTVIDRTFTLDETPEAVRYVAGKRARGKVLISMD